MATISELACRAYNAYGDDADWKNYQGGAMPAWRELPPKTRRHWCAAIAAITPDVPGEPA